MRTLRWAACLAAMPALAIAQPALIRTGTHGDYGRVVFEFPQPVEFTTDRIGDTIVLHFPGGGALPSDAGTTRNVSSVMGGADVATVTMVPGARLHIMRLGNRVVLDVRAALPAKRVAPPAPAARLQARSTRPAPEAEVVAAPPVPVPTQQATVVLRAEPPHVVEASPPSKPGAPSPAAAVASSPVPKPAPIAPPEAAAPVVVTAPALLARPVATPPPAPASPSPPNTLPPNTLPADTLALAASRIPTPVGSQGSAAVLPFGSSVAAASFRHGDEAWVVFDDRRPIDLAALAEDPVFKGAAVEVLPAATLLRVKLPRPSDIRLERLPDGWAVIAATGSSVGPALMPLNRPSRLLLPVASPGQVVVVPDADTGRNLLVGTLKAAGPGVPVAIRAPEFAIRPSWQGVVVEPVSDHTNLRTVPDGFAIETGSPLSPMPENGPALASAAALTRRFDFPSEPVPALLHRLQAQIQDIGQAPPQARLGLRKAAAQTMLALGLGAEAQSLLKLAVEEDPRAMTDPDISGLTGIAALVSFRPQEADGLDAPDLSGTDEVALWRAIRTAMQTEDAPSAAPVLAATAGLILSYPNALRDRLLPVAVETMARSGAVQAADALLASLPDEPLLTFARAIRLEQKGQTAAALTLYDALAASRDRLASVRAATRATLLRLATGAMTAADAAKSLESNFMTWRGDARERDLRLTTADIEARAGQWRKAIATLKETAQLFPVDSALIAARTTALLNELLHGPAATSMPPLDLVTLADENADTIAHSDVPGMGALLADKLMALDLPQRAGPVIERMANAAPPGVTRATLGVRLAALRFGEGDLTEAASALTATDASGLPPPLQEARGLLDARIHAQAHDTAGATAILSNLGTAAADELRASVLADSGDWHGAALALGTVVARAIPESGPLTTEQQDLLLRLASAHSRATNEAALHTLGLRQAARMTGPRGDMFRLLTDAPVNGPGDLRRVAGDIALARALPSQLNVLGAR